jgi:nucleotide-binding universal stress UspA family protein
MTIVCGTDFSEPSAAGLRVACALARKRDEKVVLVHAVDVPMALAVAENQAYVAMQAYVEAETKRSLAHLNELATRVASPGVTVEVEVVVGRADESVVARAKKLGASLVVVSALGTRGGDLFRLGSTAERIAQTSTVPAIVVRDAEPFERWARGESKLRALVGVDDTEHAAAAAAWVRRALPESESVFAHVCWPPDQVDRAAGETKLTIGSGRVSKELEAKLRARVTNDGGASAPIRIVGGLGRVADHLAEVAEQEKLDLLVVGTHHRSGLGLLWHGSVSRGAIEHARSNVAIVPTPS